MQKGHVYIHDRIATIREANISLFDLGLTRGFGVFDYLRSYNKIPFHLLDHLHRFACSANYLGMKLPKTISEMEKIVYQLLEYPQIDDANIKLILTGGISADGITYDGAPLLAIAVYPFKALMQSEKYSNGIALKSTYHVRPYPFCKTLFYLPAILALQEAKEQGFDDALYVNDKNEILEATTSNFFVVKEQILHTPEKEILKGITREVIIQLAHKIMEIKQESISYNDLQKCSEAFITASNKEIVPVVRVDEQIIGNGSVGPITQKLMQAFSEYTQKFCFEKIFS